MMKKHILIILFQLSIFNYQYSFAQFDIIPAPKSNTFSRAHNVTVDSTWKIIYNDNSSLHVAEIIQKHLIAQHQLELKIEKVDLLLESKMPYNCIALNLTENNISDTIGAYNLRMMPGEIRISGLKEGIFYGAQTFIQLSFRKLNFQSCLIDDVPKFQWRGMHLDVSRHFFDKEFIKKYIDLLALYKMNVFHWHLTDDQGWRIEIKKYPKLTSVGGFRNGSMIGHYRDQKFDTIRYGGFYTQEDIKEIVAYAKSKYITIVPEIEMPGHAVAALAAYPQYSCNGKPLEVEKMWGVFDDVYCAGNDSTFIFLQNILDEVCELFPGEYIHIGGDECPKTRWKTCERCQRKMKNEKLKDEHELQSYFIQKIEKYLNSKNKKIIGWDEILEGGLAPNAAVMSWRGEAGGIAAAKQNHYVVMSPGTHCYFDHYQADPKKEPVAIGGFTDLEKVYSYNPIPDTLSKEESKYILGAQGNVWTEYMNDEKHVEYMVLPRLAALSEVLWSVNKGEFKEFKERQKEHTFIWRKLGYNYRQDAMIIPIPPGGKK